MIEFVWLTLSNYIIGNLNTVLGILFSLALCRYTKIHYINSGVDDVNTEKLMEHIKKNMQFVQSSFIYEGEQEPYGFCVSWKSRFIAWVYQGSQQARGGNSKVTYVVFLGKLPEDIKKSEPSVKETEEVIELYLARAYFNELPQLVKLPFSGFEPTSEQLSIMNEMKDIYDKSKFNICRALVYGKPGSGKSFIGKLLAKELGSKLCFDVRLDEPGNPLMSLWKTSNPVEKLPLIVQIDEFDVFIRKLHNGELKNDHKWLRRMIYDGQTYNTFLSEYLNCMPNVIYLFTMNSTPDDINALNSSYIRKHRMDMVIEH